MVSRPSPEHWRWVLEWMPHYLEAYYILGNLLDSRGLSREAMGYFQEALRRRPSLAEAHNGLGLALANLGQTEQARRESRNRDPPPTQVCRGACEPWPDARARGPSGRSEDPV